MATPTLFTGILGVLVAMTIVLFVIAQNIVEPDLKLDDPRVAEAVQERIRPIGRLNTGDAPAPAAAAATTVQTGAAQAAETRSGAEVYDMVCHVCHSTGVLNSPKLGDAPAWTERLAKGKEALYASSINGLNQMPPKGGRPDLSDDEIRLAVDYMLERM